MNHTIKLIIGVPLIGLFSIWAAYMGVGLVVVGLVSVGLPAMPNCLLSGDTQKIRECPSIFSYSIESLFGIAFLVAIGLFLFLFKKIYRNKEK